LDIKTTLINATIINFIFSVALLIYYKYKKNFKGLPELITAFISIGFGYLILTYYNYFPNFISTIFGNILIMFGILKVLHGIVKFKEEEKTNYIFDYSMLGIFVILFLIYTYLLESVNLRIIIFSIFQILFYVKIIIHLKSNNKDIIKIESFIIRLYFIISVFVVLIRIFTILIGINMFDLMNTITITLISIMPIIVTLGMFWISSALSQNELSTNSMTDPLTGLYNREAIIKLAKIEANKHERTLGNIGIIFGDIDFFKSINDKYGHDIGDEMLISISKLLKNNLREYDLVSRYDGQVFLMIVTDINLINLYKLVEKMRSKIENRKFIIDENNISITMSFGITIFNHDEHEILDGINRAYDKLQKAKESGRNKISFK